MTAPTRPEPACEGMVSPNLDIWFSDDPTQQREAIRICGRCPLQTDCLSDAVATGDWLSVRGGMTGERRKRWAFEQGIPRHGTITGYTGDGCRCQLCRDAANEAHTAWRNRQLLPCGTEAAHRRHYRNGEQPCQPCRDAHERRNSDRRRERIAS